MDGFWSQFCQLIHTSIEIWHHCWRWPNGFTWQGWQWRPVQFHREAGEASLCHTPLGSWLLSGKGRKIGMISEIVITGCNCPSSWNSHSFLYVAEVATPPHLLLSVIGSLMGCEPICPFYSVLHDHGDGPRSYFMHSYHCFFSVTCHFMCRMLPVQLKHWIVCKAPSCTRHRLERACGWSILQKQL